MCVLWLVRPGMAKSMHDDLCYTSMLIRLSTHVLISGLWYMLARVENLQSVVLARIENLQSVVLTARAHRKSSICGARAHRKSPPDQSSPAEKLSPTWPTSTPSHPILVINNNKIVSIKALLGWVGVGGFNASTNGMGPLFKKAPHMGGQNAMHK